MSVAAAKHPSSGEPDPKHNLAKMREAYYERVARHDMAPLWKVMSTIITDEPVTRCTPVIWHYHDVKSLVMESGSLITAEEAKRRVLILENPGLRGEVARHQHIVRRYPDDPAGRSRPGPSPRLLGDPLRARRARAPIPRWRARRP